LPLVGEDAGNDPNPHRKRHMVQECLVLPLPVQKDLDTLSNFPACLLDLVLLVAYIRDLFPEGLCAV